MRRILFIISCILVPGSLSAQNYDTIKADLERDYYISQTLRESVFNTAKKYGPRSKQTDSLNSLIARFDRAALERAVYIIDNYGWLGRSQIGVEANQALFLMLQHSKDPNIREKYFTKLEKSALDGQSSLSDMAAMKDRMLVEHGKKQRYGTQRALDGKLCPVEDPDGLNQRRRQVGLKKIKKKDYK
jgi:hypothetical protein